MRLILVVVLAGLWGCAAEESDTPGEVPSDEEATDEIQDIPPELEQCDAESYRPMIGQPVLDVNLTEAESVRVFAEGAIITQEYLPQRTNIVHDEAGIVLQVYCG